MSARFCVGALVLGIAETVVVVLAAMLFSSKVFGQTSVVYTVGSHHLGGGDYCQWNPGLGLEAGGTFRRIAGFYKNSLCRTSVYAGGTYQPLQYGKWRLGVVGLGVTGYEDPVTLGAGLSLTYEGFANVIWFPNKSGNFKAGVIGLQWVKKWD